MGRQFVVYLILYFTLLFVVSALPRPETDDLLTLVPPQKQVCNFSDYFIAYSIIESHRDYKHENCLGVPDSM
jgi:hypothetical protein